MQNQQVDTVVETSTELKQAEATVETVSDELLEERLAFNGGASYNSNGGC